MATRLASPLCTRSAASRTPAPPESLDMTMTSAGATGSLTTSAHPAARKIGSRKTAAATVVAMTSARTMRIGTDFDLRTAIFRFMGERYLEKYPALATIGFESVEYDD